MKLGMIAVLAAAAFATNDDTPRLVGTALRFAARSAGIGTTSLPAMAGRRSPTQVTSARSDCAYRYGRRPTTHVTAQHVAYIRRDHAAGDSILDALRAGGLVIVFRHSTTDHSQPDAREISRTDRATQRNLTPAGVEQAKRIGESIRALGVPVDEVHASPLFRTMDTAMNAFGHVEPSEALWRTGTAAERARLLSEPPRAGTNRVLVTHNFVLIATFQGMRPGDMSEGDAIVVRPLGDGKYEVVRRITVDDWARLASGSESDGIVRTHRVRSNDVLRL